MEKCTTITVGASPMIKCANITVKPLYVPAVIELTSVTSPAECYVGDTVTVTVTCTNTSVTNGIANLKFTTVGTGTPNPASIALFVTAGNIAATTFTYVPTVPSTLTAPQTGCAELVSVVDA
jgi:hypothetical protein